MSMVGFPLLLIPLAIYNIIVFLMPGVSLAEPLVTLPLTSGAQWSLTLSDLLLALGIVMLVTPGPGLIVAAIGAALIAGKSLVAARVLDRIDLAATRLWARVRSR